jgi:NifU-like protein involved in Fe-S cluster formation
MYSEKLLERFRNPSWVGEVSGDASAVAGDVTCGDVVQMSLAVSGGIVTEARFLALGCAVAIAAADTVCELASQRTLTAAEMIDVEDIAGALGGIPEGRADCASAPLGAFRAALRRLSSDRA